MTRRSRAFAALFTFLALVFAQVAASAHLCALHQAGDAAQVIAHNDHCGGGESQNPPADGGNVCAEHCQYGKASADNGAPDVPVVGLNGPFLRVDPVSPAASASAVPAWCLAPVAAPPPPAILFGVLRI
jgi:hypothetical protein